MRESITGLIRWLLSSIGIRTINNQFLFSYILIFLCALISVVTIYLSLGVNSNAIDVAGRQRMLSQRLAKEVVMVAQQVESRSVMEKTIKLFESSHRVLFEGDEAQHIHPVKDAAILKQLRLVEQLWSSYKQVITRYAETPDKAGLAAIQEQSLRVLGEMNKAVGMMAKTANDSVILQQTIAFVMTAFILLLVVLGRVFGMTVLMNEINRLRLHLKEVSKGDFSKPIDCLDDKNEIGMAYSAYNDMLRQVSQMIKQVCQVTDQVSAATAEATQTLDRTDQASTDSSRRSPRWLRPSTRSRLPFKRYPATPIRRRKRPARPTSRPGMDRVLSI